MLAVCASIVIGVGALGAAKLSEREKSRLPGLLALLLMFLALFVARYL